MGIDDYVNAETGLLTAATAAAVSPRARELLRRGAVYGIAGAMRAGDVVAAAARGAVRGARESIAQENGAATEGGTERTPGGGRTASGAGATGSRSGASSGQSRSSGSRSPSAASRSRGTPPSSA